MNVLSLTLTSLVLAAGFGPVAPAEPFSTRPTPDHAQPAAPDVAPEAGFAFGSWAVGDGGNYYLGMTQHAGQLKVTNNGPGRVSVHIQWFSGFYTTVHLPPGATLCREVGPNVHVEIWDGGRDGLGANGTYAIP